MPESINTISASIAGICRLQENLTAISGMLDDQFDDLQTLFDHLQNGVIDISRLSPEEVNALAIFPFPHFQSKFPAFKSAILISDVITGMKTPNSQE